MPTHASTYLPEELVTQRFAKMVEALEEEPGEACLLVGGKRIELTKEVADILTAVARAMERGLAVSVVPQNTRMTTQEAADFLGMSRSTLVRMLEAGEIPFEKVRRHRRLLLSDVLEYRERQRRCANEALADMVADGQAMGAYDIDPAEARRALARIRAGE